MASVDSSLQDPHPSTSPATESLQGCPGAGGFSHPPLPGCLLTHQSLLANLLLINQNMALKLIEIAVVFFKFKSIFDFEVSGLLKIQCVARNFSTFNGQEWSGK